MIGEIVGYHNEMTLIHDEKGNLQELHLTWSPQQALREMAADAGQLLSAQCKVRMNDAKGE